MYDRYQTKNTGAVCYLACMNLLSIKKDIEICRNKEGFVVVSFIPTDKRMDAFRDYVRAFKYRETFLVDIVNYNSVFNSLKQRISNYKNIKNIKNIK